MVATSPAETSAAPVVQAPDCLRPEALASEEEPPAAPGLLGSTRLYLAFLVVGSSSGWLANKVYAGYGASYAGVQESNFYGATALIEGVLSLGLALLWAIFAALRPRGLSRRASQVAVGGLCLMTMAGQVVLAPWWSVQDDDGNYPVLLLVYGFGIVVSVMSSFIALPLVASHYGGWLVAPFRTDVSLLLSALLSLVQSPMGGDGPHLFPAWVLQVIYSVLAAAGLAAWVGVVRTGAGLRCSEADNTGLDDEQQQQNEVSSPPAAAAAAKPAASRGLAGLLESLACPRQLLLPVLVGMASTVNSWALVAPIANNSARMADPVSCDGSRASAMFKYATTAAACLLPLASLLSSLGRCPRPLFYALFLLQCLCVLALWLSLHGVGREAFWQTELGSTVWSAAYSLTGALEGYLLTQTYRYIGDDPGIPTQARSSASSLVSFLGVLVMNSVALALGVHMLNGGLECFEVGGSILRWVDSQRGSA